jgi:hypothetical protein
MLLAKGMKIDLSKDDPKTQKAHQILQQMN